MKPAPFRLHRPTTVAEATAVFGEYGDEAKVLAGGQSLVPMLALRLTRFEHLVDLNGVAELRGIERENGTLARRCDGASGGGGTQRRRRPRACPCSHRAMPLIGHFQIRNRGTVGGSHRPRRPGVGASGGRLALDAELEVTRARRRTDRRRPRDFFAVDVDDRRSSPTSS